MHIFSLSGGTSAWAQRRMHKNAACALYEGVPGMQEGLLGFGKDYWVVHEVVPDITIVL